MTPLPTQDTMKRDKQQQHTSSTYSPRQQKHQQQQAEKATSNRPVHHQKGHHGSMEALRFPADACAVSPQTARRGHRNYRQHQAISPEQRSLDQKIHSQRQNQQSRARCSVGNQQRYTSLSLPSGPSKTKTTSCKHGKPRRPEPERSETLLHDASVDGHLPASLPKRMKGHNSTVEVSRFPSLSASPMKRKECNPKNDNRTIYHHFGGHQQFSCKGISLQSPSSATRVQACLSPSMFMMLKYQECHKRISLAQYNDTPPSPSIGILVEAIPIEEADNAKVNSSSIGSSPSSPRPQTHHYSKTLESSDTASQVLQSHHLQQQHQQQQQQQQQQPARIARIDTTKLPMSLILRDSQDVRGPRNSNASESDKAILAIREDRPKALNLTPKGPSHILQISRSPPPPPSLLELEMLSSRHLPFFREGSSKHSSLGVDDIIENGAPKPQQIAPLGKGLCVSLPTLSSSLVRDVSNPEVYGPDSFSALGHQSDDSFSVSLTQLPVLKTSNGPLSMVIEEDELEPSQVDSLLKSLPNSQAIVTQHVENARRFSGFWQENGSPGTTRRERMAQHSLSHQSTGRMGPDERTQMSVRSFPTLALYKDTGLCSAEANQSKKSLKGMQLKQDGAARNKIAGGSIGHTSSEISSGVYRESAFDESFRLRPKKVEGRISPQDKNEIMIGKAVAGHRRLKRDYPETKVSHGNRQEVSGKPATRNIGSNSLTRAILGTPKFEITKKLLNAQSTKTNNGEVKRDRKNSSGGLAKAILGTPKFPITKKILNGVKAPRSREILEATVKFSQ